MSNELQKPAAGALSARPDFLGGISKEDFGTEVLSQYVSPPFIKVVQSNSKEPYNQYEDGSVLAVPLNQQLFAPGQSFHITPIFMYPEYVLTNPFTLKHLPFIRERSLDQKGELARKCRDFANRMVVCPEAPADKQQDSKFQCAYYEHLNFACLIWEHEVFSVNPIIFTFRSSEFKSGRKLSGMIHTRNAPIAALRFSCWTGIHNSSGNENWGLNFDNPAADGMSPWLTEEEFAETNRLHLEFKELHERGAIKVDLDDESAEKDATADAPDM